MIRIIGVGNIYRGDDAAGLLAARQLRSLALPGVTVLEQSGEAAALLAAWQGADQVIVIDAAASGAAPGFIHRFELPAATLPTPLTGRSSSHGFGVAEAVGLADRLGCLPERLTIYGIEGVDFSLGAGLSTAVASAIPTLIAQIVAEFGAT